MCPHCGGRKQCWCRKPQRKLPPGESIPDLEGARRAEIKRAHRLFVGEELDKLLRVIEMNFGEGV
jgi:hypothetical protein